MVKGLCFSCQKELVFNSDVGRREECSHCGADVHVCKNCLFYDPKSYNECRETQAEAVREKERANFCDYFQWSGSTRSQGTSSVDLKAQAEALFKNWGKK